MKINKKKVVSPEILEQIASDLVAALTSGLLDLNHLEWRDYHEFRLSTLPPSFVVPFCAKQSLDMIGKIQIDFIQVTSDLRHQTHRHRESIAYIRLLGSSTGFVSPKRAWAYLEDHWFKIVEDDHLIVYPGVVHGFTVESGGHLTFLSLQSPPIVRPDRDDYEQVAVIAETFPALGKNS